MVRAQWILVIKIVIVMNIFVVLQSLSPVWLFATPWTAAHQASPSFTISWSLLKLISIESVIPSNHCILHHLLLLLSSIFSSIKVFSSDPAFCIRWPQCWNFSFSISPSNEYPGLISLRLTGLISFLSKESSLVPQFEGINSLVLYLLYSPALTAIRDHWEDHSFDYSRALN